MVRVQLRVDETLELPVSISLAVTPSGVAKDQTQQAGIAAGIPTPPGRPQTAASDLADCRQEAEGNPAAVGKPRAEYCEAFMRGNVDQVPKESCRDVIVKREKDQNRHATTASPL